MWEMGEGWEMGEEVDGRWMGGGWGMDGDGEGGR
jgi:hypothetical protein